MARKEKPFTVDNMLISILDQLSEDSNCHVEILSSPNNGDRSCLESIRGIRLLKCGVGAPEELFQAWISIGFQVEWL